MINVVNVVDNDACPDQKLLPPGLYENCLKYSCISKALQGLILPVKFLIRFVN